MKTIAKQLTSVQARETSPSSVFGFTRKRLFQIHGWLGMSCGVLLFVICFSGAAAALSHEIDWSLNPAIRVWPSEGEYLGWGAWRQAAEKAQPDWKIQWIAAPLNSYFAAEVVTEAPSGRIQRIYVNPYTGKVQGTTSFFNVQRFLRDFHRMLNMGSAGLYVVSLFGFALLFSVVSGLLFYKNWWRNLFQLRFRKGARAMWSDIHRFAGVWSFLFAAIIAVTGIWYLLENAMYQNGSLRDDPAPKIRLEKLSAYGPALRIGDLDRLVSRARYEIPDLKVRTVWFPRAPDDAIRIDGQAGAWLVRDRANEVHLDPYSGEVLGVQRGEQLHSLVRWQDTADPLHFGDFGGLTTKMLWSLFGLSLPIMVLTGSYLSLRQGTRTPPSAGIRFWRWKWWAWASFVVLAASVYNSVGAITRYRAPAGPVFTAAGDITVGPWLVSLSTGGHRIRARFACEGCEPNIRSMQAQADDTNRVKLRQSGKIWKSPRLRLPKTSESLIVISVTDRKGQIHSGRLAVSRASLTSEAEESFAEGPFTGPGVALFLIPFIGAMLAVVFFWYSRFASKAQQA